MDNALVTAPTKGLDSVAKRTLTALLGQLKHGSLTLVDGGQQTFGTPEGIHATLTIHHPSAYRQIVMGGSIGAGEAFIKGHWSSPNRVALIQLFCKNLSLIEKLESKISWLTKIPSWIGHRINHNSKKGSKRNIVAHYDLGNPLYETFLDKQMLYSSAVFPHWDSSLEQAQLHKMALICDKLRLQPGEHLVEIGTGWGALAIYAAKHYGVKVTTTTISDAQHEYAKKRIEEEGLGEQITLLKQDYRDLNGQYDKLVSIEMIEAVGHRYFSQFFQQCTRLLKPSGRMLIQAITIADQRYSRYVNSVDFIQRYIFPGGCLPSIERLGHHIAKDTDMVMEHLEDIGLHYAHTLKAWQQRFCDALTQVRSLGYGEDFIRMWQFYFDYCQGAFLERQIGTVQVVANRPDYRG